MIPLPRRTLRTAADLGNSDKGRVAASRLGDYLGMRLLDNSELPVNLRTLAEFENVGIVRSSTIAGPGRIGWSSMGLRIVIRLSDPETRQRFTIAHELGHHLLFGIQQGDTKPRFSHEEEKRCDKFATSLLMPGLVFSKQFNNRRTLPSAAAILELAALFEVSLETVMSRVTELGLLSPDTILLKCEYGGHSSAKVDSGGYYRAKFDRRLEDLTMQDLGLDDAATRASAMLGGASSARVPTTVRLPQRQRGLPRHSWSYLPAEVTFIPLREDLKLMLVEIDLAAPHLSPSDHPQEWARQESFGGVR